MIGKKNFQKRGLAITTIMMFLVSWVSVSAFANLRNVNVIAIGRVPVILFALASMIPLAVGEFDISLGYMLGVLMMLGGKIASIGGTALGVAVAIVGSSIIIGLINGLVTVYLKIPSTISTLATGMIMYGGSLGLNGGKSFTGVIPELLIWISKIKILKLNLAVWICLIVVFLIYLIMEHTPLGYYIYAIGQSERVTELAGINTKLIRCLSFVITSLLVGICAIILCGQSRNVYPDTGPGYLLPGLAVTFLSTTTHTPGRYNAPGILWGAILLGIIFNVISILGAPFWCESVINGLVLLGVVILINGKK